MNTNSVSGHSTNIHSTTFMSAYPYLGEAGSEISNPLITTYDLLSIIRLDCLVIMSAIEADALEEEYHHQKIQQIQRDVLQLKEYYLKAIPLFKHDDCD